MESSPHQARDILDIARQAFRSGDYLTALENYSYFFEHALDGDPASLYGVRLSYCLNEWARLGRKYPPALAALEARRREALQRLETTRDPEHFHDFECISEYLGVHGDAIEQFTAYHRSDPELAKSIVRFVWSELVETEAWDLCRDYLGDADERYDNAMAKFDEAFKVSHENPEFGGADFDAQIQGWYIRDVTEIILVLANCGRVQEAKNIQARAILDSGNRGYPAIGEPISSRIAL